MRRLTRAEYARTVGDLFGFALPPEVSFVEDEDAGFFRNDAAALTTSPVLVEQYLAASETLAARAAAPAALARLLPCASSASDACAQELIAGFGKRAWRRPLAKDEIDHMTRVFQGGKAMGGFAGGVELVLRTFLLSPAFVFRMETGVPIEGRADLLRPSSWEMASRLSYLFWGTMPDAALFAAAQQDALRTPAQVAAQATRLLSSERAREPVAEFFDQWLSLAKVDDIDKDKAVFPSWSSSLVPLMRQEVNAFVADAVFGAEGTVGAFYTTPRSFMNKALAGFYGVGGPAGTAFQPVALDPAKRGGLLTLGGLLAALAETNATSPILRGAFVRQHLLCEVLPPPPPGVDNTPPPPSKTTTTRERFKQHSSDPACAGCHRLLDPVGFGLERFDGVSLLRDTENGKPIDDAGEVAGHPIGAFRGALELGRKLAASPEAAGCIARQWLTFALGGKADDGNGAAVARALPAGPGRFKDLLLAVAQSPGFLFIARSDANGGAP
jgi:hypothetical protein